MHALLEAQVFYKTGVATVEDIADASVRLARHLDQEIGIVYGTVALIVSPATAPDGLADDLHYIDYVARKLYRRPGSTFISDI